MAITATLVGAQYPQLVQITVSATPVGQTWVLTGTAAGFTWTVPGGRGVGDGSQLVIADNRAPGNVPIVYTFTPAVDAPQSTAPIVVPSGEFTLQSLDGQLSITPRLLAGSLDTEQEVAQARFYVANRRRPVVRYSATSDIGGELSLLVDTADSAELQLMLATGQPLLFRAGKVLSDMPLVGVIAYGNPSSVGFPNGHARRWSLPYILVDDPFMDTRLGAFSWDYFDGVFSGGQWTADFDAVMVGRSWNTFDSLDWSTI